MRHVTVTSVEDAVALIPDGARILVGGFGMTGSPVHLLHALAERPVTDLTIVSNNVGEPGLGGGRLLRNGQIREAVGSFFTSNPEAVAATRDGSLDIELIPQGTLAEAIRAGGAGIGGFYTPTAAGTRLAEGQDVRVIGGVEQVFVEAIRGDVALIRAWRADTTGNLVFRRTERNFNPLMAMAADLVIVEAEEVVDAGSLDPDSIHTPGVFVDVVTQAHTLEDDLGSSARLDTSKQPSPTRQAIAERAFRELSPGDVVNLGVGIPTLVADFIGPGDGMVLHTENGMTGVGPAPDSGGAMDYPVNAGKLPVTALPGAAYFDSADSFAMIRGGHVDAAIMGGLQVDQHANLANWAVPGKPVLGVGGAMDLATNARRLIITMTHVTRKGDPKLVPELTLPATARGKVDTLITDMGVFKWPGGQCTLVEIMGDHSVEDIRAETGLDFEVALTEE